MAGAGSAQSAVVGGRVIRLVAGDSVPVPAARLVLHQLARSAQGPIDTVLADFRGRFRTRFAPDTAAMYLLSVRYQGIEYFSAPVRARPGRADTALVLIVADTSSTAPVRVAERTVLISRADAGGTREVIDWFVLENPGPQTRVAPDSSRPSWSSPLPEAAQNAALADIHFSQFSPDAIGFSNDSIQVLAPISPGRKELVLQYRIPERLRRFVAPAAGADSVFVLLEDPGARVERPGLRAGEGQQVEGRRFARWSGVLGSAPAIEVSFPAGGISPGTALPLLLGLAALAFAALGFLLFRRAPRPAFRPALDPAGLADAIARLDLAASRADPALDPDGLARYQEERARLKALLVRALAASRGRS